MIARYPFLPLAALVVLCLIAAWLDVRERRLPNWLIVMTLAAGLFATAMSDSDPSIASHVLHFSIALVAGFALYAIGLFGGGDAKFYAALAAWFPLTDAGNLALTVGLCGLLMVSVWFIWRRLKGIPIRMRATADADKFPYGVAIAAGGALYFTGFAPLARAVGWS